MQNGFLKPRTKSDLIVAATNGHARIHSESDNSNSLNSSHQSLGSSGGLGGGHHPTHFNTLPHPHHHQHSHANNSSTDPNAGSRTLKHHSTQQETRVTQIIRELQQMGPDGQQMDYSGVSGRGNTGNAQMADYGTTGYGTTPRPHYVSNPAQDHMTYDPMQDPYYGRGVLPPEAGQQERYVGGDGSYAGGGDYEHEQYIGEYRTYGAGPHHQPSAYYMSDRPNSPPSLSERSDSPSVVRPLTSDYMRQAGYPPTGYEEIDSGMVPPSRPEYLTPLTNTHPNNYGEIEEERGRNGGYLLGGNWGTSGGGSTANGPTNSSTSHYGNLPVRPYLLASGTGTTLHSTTDNQVEEVSSENPSPVGGDHGVPNTNNSNSTMSSGEGRVGSHLGHGGSTGPTTSTTHLHHHVHPHQHSHQNDSPSSSTNTNNAGVRWRDPDLHEVIQFLGNPNPVVKANAAAYLQHLCYMDDPVKTKTRVLGGIPPLVALLSHEQPEVHRNACGALRNLSYGRQNDENKKAIKSAGGIPSLVRLLKKTHDGEVKELVSGVLWNLSSCEELKKAIIDDGVVPLVNVVIIPHSGWDRNNVSGTSSNHIPDPCWSTVFKNASGVFRNISSAGEYARKKLRECEGLVEALLHVVRSALARAEVDDKSVENCVCILRNLSYRCQEVEDPNYDKHPPPLAQNRATAAPTAKGDNLGCFGAKKKKEAALAASSPKEGNSVNAGTGTTRSASQVNRGEPISGMELLWQPEVVQAYLALLSNCSNPETLEAAAGAIQNLAACYWQPSIEIRAAVRKEKGLPVLVELLRVEVDRVVCAVATALRNLAIDQRNKELIGKYAMRDLVQKLPSGRPFDQGASDDTIAAVLATLNEVIKKNAEFSGSLLEAEGVERLVFLTQQKRRFSPRVVKFASQVLYSLWQHQDNREVYKKAGWTEQDFVSKGSGGRSGSPGPGGSGTDLNSAGSPVNNANSTLNRPMASQSGTRYEDKTMQRGNNVPKSPPPSYPQGEEVPLGSAMPYPEGSHAPPPPGAFRMYPSPPVKPGEPLYAQVNREKKKNRGYEGPNSRGGYQGGLYNSSPLGEPTHSNWQESTNSVTHSIDNLSHQPAGDSWV